MLLEQLRCSYAGRSVGELAKLAPAVSSTTGGANHAKCWRLSFGLSSCTGPSDLESAKLHAVLV